MINLIRSFSIYIRLIYFYDILIIVLFYTYINFSIKTVFKKISNLKSVLWVAAPHIHRLGTSRDFLVLFQISLLVSRFVTVGISLVVVAG